MTPDERQMLADLFQRLGAAAQTPRDAQAEAFINDSVRAQPYAPYLLAQTVLVQSHALEGAQRRISELEAQVQSAAQAPAQETSFLGGLGRSLFGGATAPPQPPRPNAYDASGYSRAAGAPPAQPAYAPAPQQSYAPQPQAYAPQPGPWGSPPSAGGGFLSSALTTAAGVAGGMVLANSLEHMLGGGRGGLFGGGFGASGFGGEVPVQETINNYYEAPPEHSQGFDSPSTGGDGFLGAAGGDDVSDNGGWDDSSGGDSGGGFDT